MEDGTFSHVDRAALARDLDALRAEAEASLGPDDLTHLLRMERWGRTCTAVGYATAWIAPNPFSMIALSTGSAVRWAIVAHHVLHKGYDKVPGTPARLTSTGFAAGSRRWIDWNDWMLPDAWRLEHNVLHHYHTGEVLDPDLVEENVQTIRAPGRSAWVRYGVIAFYALTWKLTYYAPNTYQILRRSERLRAAGAPAVPKQIALGPESYLEAFDPRTADGRRFLRECVLPYALSRFAAIPALFAPLGPVAVANVAINSLGAELLSNLHSFLIIAPNHAGEDLYRFEGSPKGRGDFYLRQIVGSVDYRTGGDVRDFLQGFLNYQIEHHLWPDLPARAYQRLQPRVREVCAKHGVPYVQEGLGARVRKLVRIMAGTASMRRMSPPATDAADCQPASASRTLASR